jgi:hypothetical protein
MKIIAEIDRSRSRITEAPRSTGPWAFSRAVDLAYTQAVLKNNKKILRKKVAYLNSQSPNTCHITRNATHEAGRGFGISNKKIVT